VSTGKSKSTLDLIDTLSNVNLNQPLINKFTWKHENFIPQVNLNNLDFSYFGNNQKSLVDISLSINSGELVAITGPSGAGKTTLIDCIIGAFTTQQGTVLISGVPPLEAIEKWPGAIGYVPQEVVILNATVRENVVFGYSENEVPENLVEEALKKAHLFEHVSGLNEGINSYVGDRGTKLSGGQRQRLGIARALVSKPKLLILDEATSSLDTVSERQVQEAIDNLMKNRTSIVIAHRLSTVQNADEIIVLEQGEIRERGTHAELISQQGIYKKLVEMQHVLQ
jgi:ABC-type multidrug transport system fused ATPase/permease subunit